MKRIKFLLLISIVLSLGIILCSCITAVIYTLYFDVDGVTYDTITTSGDEVIDIPKNPIKERYIFDGWYWRDGNAFTVNSLLDAPISTDMTVYAKWITEAEYTIIFDSDGGSSVDTLILHGGQSIDVPKTPTKLGYTFEGWYTDYDAYNNVYSFGVIPENGITLYAKWKANNSDPYLSISGGFIDGTNIYLETTYENLDLSSLITVASDSSWRLFSDALGQNIIPTKYAYNLNNGSNKYYVVIDSPNGTNRTW